MSSAQLSNYSHYQKVYKPLKEIQTENYNIWSKLSTTKAKIGSQEEWELHYN